MDFEKLKGIAKTATKKTMNSIAEANEKRKKANQETKIFLPATGGMASAHWIRKNVEGKYYIGGYTEKPVLFEFAGFEFAGSQLVEKTITKGKTKQQGRTGSVLGGAALGSIIAPGVGTIVGGMAGGARKKKGKIDSTSVTTVEEKPGKATVQLRNIETGEITSIQTKLTQAEANNVQLFFLG